MVLERDDGYRRRGKRGVRGNQENILMTEPDEATKKGLTDNQQDLRDPYGTELSQGINTTGEKAKKSRGRPKKLGTEMRIDDYFLKNREEGALTRKEKIPRTPTKDMRNCSALEDVEETPKNLTEEEGVDDPGTGDEAVPETWNPTRNRSLSEGDLLNRDTKQIRCDEVSEESEEKATDGMNATPKDDKRGDGKPETREIGVNTDTLVEQGETEGMSVNTGSRGAHRCQECGERCNSSQARDDQRLEKKLSMVQCAAKVARLEPLKSPYLKRLLKL